MSTWYYSDLDRNRLGPVAASDLAELHANGQLAPEVLVWREGMPEWKPWREVMAEVLGLAPVPAQRASFAVAGADAPAHASGNPYEVVERVQASPYAAPSATLGGGSAVYHDGEVVDAGFWKRVAAYLIDSFIVGMAGAVMGGVVGAMMGAGMAVSGTGGAGGMMLVQVVTWLLGIAIGIAYYAGFHASGMQATPGKMAVGIKVVRPDGEGISFARGAGRYFAAMLSGLLLCVGYLMAAFTARKQALHDMMTDTLVVDRWAFTAHPERQQHGLGTVATVVLVVGGIGALAFVGLIAVAVVAVSR